MHSASLSRSSAGLRPQKIQQRQAARPSRSAKPTRGGTRVACALDAVPHAIEVVVSNPVFGDLAADDGPGAATLAAVCGGAIVGLGALLNVTDPNKRREKMAEESGGDEMKSVKKYFETEGFQRWNKIYGETDEVNKVQLDIRTGHAQTVEKVINWLKEDKQLATGISVCDAGCGTGSLSVPLAMEGAAVFGSDISAAMAEESERRYKAEVEKTGKTGGVEPVFAANDLESITGKYHTVSCLDVMIHYPQEKADGMITHLASLAEERLIISFAPKTPYYSVLKRIGELAPGPSKATRAYLHAEADVEKALNAAGWKVTKREMTATSFYFSRLLEATRA